MSFDFVAVFLSHVPCLKAHITFQYFLKIHFKRSLEPKKKTCLKDFKNFSCALNNSTCGGLKTIFLNARLKAIQNFQHFYV